MHTNGECTQCGAKIRFGISLCRECLNIKRHNAAIISQNKKKLKKLLDENTLNLKRMDRFILYSDNIIKCGKVIMDFQEKGKKRVRDRVIKYGMISCWIIFMIGVVIIQI